MEHVLIHVLHSFETRNNKPATNETKTRNAYKIKLVSILKKG